MRRGQQRHRSLVHELGARERDGKSRHLVDLVPRERWAMDQVLSREDCAVLLGFSSDGNYLLYYSVWESSYVVTWKRIASPFGAATVELKLALRLEVGKQVPMARPFGAPNVGSSLRVWQSTDDHMVVVVAADNQLASQDTGPSYHFTLSPSPQFCNSHGSHVSESISFSYTLPSTMQEIEPWQLVTLGSETYHLIVNMGSSVVLLAFRLELKGMLHAPMLRQPRSRVHFEERPWYTPSEYPIEFTYDIFRASPTASKLVTMKCISQQEFDCEAFLGNFFQKYAAFRHLHLVDYDVQLVRMQRREMSLFMTCVADLESSPSISSCRIEQSRLALFFSVEVCSGDYNVIRALRVPRQQPLRQLLSVLARKFATDLGKHALPDHIPPEWTNEPVVREQSLMAVHNPRFPVSIYFK